jgi:hypothetical protein
MTKVAQHRVWPIFDPALFAVALLLFALAVPLGLARVEVAPQVAAALVLDTSAQSEPFALLAMRVGQLIPLGDAPFRANLVSAVMAALAIAFLGRLCLEAVMLLRPPVNARQESSDFLYEPIAAGGAAIGAVLSLAVFDLGATAGSAAATLAVLVGGLLAGFALLRESSDQVAGYALAGLAGFSAGVDSVAGPLLWPPLAALTIWSLRKGSRWPLFAPLCFVVGWGGAVLARVSASAEPLSLGSLLSGMGFLGFHGGAELWATAVELCDEIGVIGVLLAVIGMVVLATRAAALTAWLVLTLFTSLLFAHSVERGFTLIGPTRAALPLAIAVSCVFASVGLLHVSGRLGRARVAATLTLAVILLLSPAMDGGTKRWLPHAGLPMHLLDRALERAEIRSVVYPGTPEMEGLFGLAHALGLRPDLEIGKRTGQPR